MSEPWRGKYVWIWQLDQSGEPRQIITRALGMGLTGLLVKGWDGSRYWPQIGSIAGPAHDAGLLVGAWGYSYGTDPRGEAKAAAQAVAAGADWLVVDAEEEYEKPAGADMATRLGTAFRNIFSGIPVGYTSFGIPDLHPEFPWDEFSRWCDAVLPQVYWGLFKMTPEVALSRCLAGLKQFYKPVVPAGQCYGEVATDEIVRFGRLAENAGLPGISYYDWQHARSVQLEAVGAAPYGRWQDKVGDWAKSSWEKAQKAGAFDGSSPGGFVTREMDAVVLDRMGLFDAADIPQEAVDQLLKMGLITGSHPAGARVTWGELATVIGRLVEMLKGK
ncbi:hypothetical protein [Desulfotomaculum copahuensis]|uniref:Uncharacterized protein n=1 Tax=Desulfotomaculum copahuensis TaxID=1838280 RepID=A0A1B7LG83_9FIRM|nr:hypothetical protein [Desulfotomaculum copahuensis]OAT84846.1 hypothetical protein A6M21_07450 [Desulfotomaculum copahuensis]